MEGKAAKEPRSLQGNRRRLTQLIRSLLSVPMGRQSPLVLRHMTKAGSRPGILTGLKLGESRAGLVQRAGASPNSTSLGRALFFYQKSLKVIEHKYMYYPFIVHSWLEHSVVSSMAEKSLSMSLIF